MDGAKALYFVCMNKYFAPLKSDKVVQQPCVCLFSCICTQAYIQSVPSKIVISTYFLLIPPICNTESFFLSEVTYSFCLFIYNYQFIYLLYVSIRLASYHLPIFVFYLPFRFVTSFRYYVTCPLISGTYPHLLGPGVA